MNQELKVIAILEISLDVWAACTVRYLKEGRWNNVKGLLVRVDPARPDMKLRRHVAIAEPKHLRAKNMQVSWDDAGQRHDKKTFNDKFARMNLAKDIARDRLGLPPEAILEEFLPDPNQNLNELLSENAAAANDYADAIWFQVGLDN